MMKALTADFSWLFSFSSIREKIHDRANVELLHVNELEAHRLFERLTREQLKMKELALKEEQEG